MKKYSLSVFLFFTSLIALSQIKRVEPPNWWVGMVSNTLELLVYGDEMGTYEVTLEDYPGVHLDSVIAPENKNYVFLKLSISDTAKPGELSFRFKKRNNELTQSYSLWERDEGRSSIAGFDASDAIYLITPDRFVNGDPGNDEIERLKEGKNRDFKGGRHGGDIAGVARSLDYIKDLGFTAIWLNPVLENDMETYSYHGYSTTDFYKVDPRYGTNASFKALCETAKDKGMKVIMDMIANHCGLDHWWMTDLPSKDWINQWPEYTGTNHQKTVILDPYVSQLDYKQFFDGWFVPSMPDLNQRNVHMAKYLIQNSIWWIEYSGISGIRMDTYPYPDMYFMADWTEAVMKEYPNFNIVGEEWVTRPTIVSYWQKGKQNANGYKSSLKSLMDFPLQNALVVSLNKEKNWASSWTDVYAVLAQDYLYPDPYNLVVFPDNHDMSRIFTQVNEDFDLFKLAMIYTATVRGIPQVYYGTELLMKNPDTEDHGVIRSDFPGGWIGDTTNAFTGQGLDQQQREAQQFVKKIFNWRKGTEVIHRGKLMHFAPKNQEEVYVFFRYNDQEKIMVILNKNPERLSLSLSQYKELIGQELIGHDILTGKAVEAVSSLVLEPMQSMIIEIK